VGARVAPINHHTLTTTNPDKRIQPGNVSRDHPRGLKLLPHLFLRTRINTDAIEQSRKTPTTTATAPADFNGRNRFVIVAAIVKNKSPLHNAIRAVFGDKNFVNVSPNGKPRITIAVSNKAHVPSDPKKILALLTSAHFHILSIH
jgi:hypothetical protein